MGEGAPLTMFAMAPIEDVHRPGDKEVRRQPVDNPDKVNYRLPVARTTTRSPELDEGKTFEREAVMRAKTIAKQERAEARHADSTRKRYQIAHAKGSRAAVAKRFGVNESTVGKCKQDHGTSAARRPVALQKKVAAAEGCADGVALEFGVSVASVYHYRAKYHASASKKKTGRRRIAL